MISVVCLRAKSRATTTRTTNSPSVNSDGELDEDKKRWQAPVILHHRRWVPITLLLNLR